MKKQTRLKTGQSTKLTCNRNIVAYFKVFQKTPGLYMLMLDLASVIDTAADVKLKVLENTVLNKHLFNKR